MTADRPAILGGTPVRPSGPPGWPPRADAADALRALAATGDWGRYHGPNVPALTDALSAMHGGAFVHPCSSGTAAVELALRAAGVTPGDEVILAAYDFKSNPSNVLALGAVPVPVDVRADDFQLDADHLAEAATDRTRAILVSHLHGGVVDTPAVRAFADAQGFAVVEDACQCPGAWLHGRTAGLWGDAAAVSFGGGKPLSAGRGGAVLTRDARLAQRVRLHTERGNDLSPLSEMQAAVLLPQIARLAERNRVRGANADRLRGRLASVAGLEPLAPASTAQTQPGFYKYGLRYDPAAFGGLGRDRFAEAVRAEGVALSPGWRSLPRQFSSRRYRAAGPLPHADAADRSILVLHHPVLLGGDAALDEVLAAVAKVRAWAGEISSLAATGGSAPSGRG